MVSVRRGGVSLQGGVSVLEGLCLGGSLSWRVSVLEGLCPGESLSGTPTPYGYVWSHRGGGPLGRRTVLQIPPKISLIG